MNKNPDFAQLSKDAHAEFLNKSMVFGRASHYWASLPKNAYLHDIKQDKNGIWFLIVSWLCPGNKAAYVEITADNCEWSWGESSIFDSHSEDIWYKEISNEIPKEFFNWVSKNAYKQTTSK